MYCDILNWSFPSQSDFKFVFSLLKTDSGAMINQKERNLEMTSIFSKCSGPIHESNYREAMLCYVLFVFGRLVFSK